MIKHILSLAIYALPLCALAAPTLPTTGKPNVPIDLEKHLITGGRLIEQTFNGDHYLTTRYNFDGLGRPYQRIAVQASPAGRDVIDFVVYDCMGRRDSIAYLPYTKANAPTFSGTPQEQAAFYDNLLDDKQDARYAYAVKVYDRSPLGCVQSRSAPGAVHHALCADGEPVRYRYRLNAFPVTIALPSTPVAPGTTVPSGTLPGSPDFPNQAVQPLTLDSVKRFSVTDAGVLCFEGYYPLNALSVVIAEQRTMQQMVVTTYDYTDNRGNKVARKVTGGSDVQWSYNVYDDYGRLRYEIPPILNGRFSVVGTSASPTSLTTYCTYREYDGRGNCIVRRNPGQKPIYTVYDKQDRPILFQDGNRRTAKEWIYANYDDYDRVQETRLVTCSEGVSVIRDWFADVAGYDAHKRVNTHFTTLMQLSRSVYGGYDDYDLVAGTTLIQGGDIASPGGVPDVPTVLPPPGEELVLPERRKVYHPFMIPADLAFEAVAEVVSVDDCSDDVTGLKVYERLAILPDAETDTTAYVERAMYYDREGRMIQSVTRNHLGGVSRLSYRYDYPGNLLVQHEWRQAAPGAEPDVKITRNVFDRHGRLLSTGTQLNNGPEAMMNYTYDERSLLRGATAGAGTLHESFRYDIAGRLTSQDNELFRMALRREKPHRAASRATFTGQVSECCWKHKNFPGTEQTYAYYYDPWGQFKTAFHYEGDRRTDRFTENGIAYDLNGNITALTRTNDTQSEAKLTYRYSGNLLIDVKDKQTIVNRFSYDANGNVSSASRKGWKYDYNYLNLTERITDERFNAVAEYRYLSDGTKIGVKDKAGYGYEYLGSLIYRRTPTGLKLESTDFAGGRIVRTATGYAIRYFVRDYLGSVRAVADAQGRRIEANDYMPFGSRWNDPTRLTTDNRYLFNGKEWQPTGGVKVLDYGARHYDPELGRWFNPDPAMQFLNPYTFCANDPVNLVDFNGCEATPHGYYLTDQGEIGAFLEYLANNGILIDMDNLMNFLSVQNAIMRGFESGGGTSDLYVRLPTMVVERFGPKHLKKLQRIHEDLMRRLNHLLTMNNPVVKGIHNAQTNFLRTTIDLTGFTLETMGQGLQYSSIALASSGLGVEAGAVVYGVSKILTLAGITMRGSINVNDGDYVDAAKSVGSYVLFNGISRVGSVTKLSSNQQFIWDVILMPYNDTFNKLIE